MYHHLLWLLLLPAFFPECELNRAPINQLMSFLEPGGAGLFLAGSSAIYTTLIQLITRKTIVRAYEKSRRKILQSRAHFPSG